ncbi:type II secretion system F family protein [Actinopolymorpha sp. NPDC004070]|uniref:type II secretion system F family protein n=1 Tax=Actinopolymorpha sp. NPDC004070 TaxID=3154548 RepID=UPI0033BAEFB0
MSFLAAALVGLAVAMWAGPATARRRLDHIRPRLPMSRAHLSRAHPPAPGNERRNQLLAAALAGCAVAVVVGGVIGPVLGAAVAFVVPWVLGRLEPRAVRRRREQLVADLPFVADLLAGCLRAGSSPQRAIEAIAVELDGPTGSALGQVATAFRLGANARTAWAGFLAEDALASFGRAMVRVWDSGAPLATTLDRLADDARATLRSRNDQRARTVGVHAAAPLGLCFLPAFVLVGIVPLVAGAVDTFLR